MTFKVERNSKVPVYCQIADWLEGQIRNGTLKEGQRLPSERDMCGRTGAARNTVKRAYEELARRRCIVTGQGSGSYIECYDRENERKSAERSVREAVKKLCEKGLTWHEIEHVFLENIWNRIPEAEKIRVAWVDCSVEILHDTAREIEKACNVRVVPLLLDDVSENGSVLLSEAVDVVATTINHFEDLKHLVEKQAGGPHKFCMDMVVLTISRMCVSRLALIEADMRVVAVYAGEWYRYSLECYLNEFSVKGEVIYVPLDQVMNYLEHNSERRAVILPQDLQFKDGLVGRIYEYCREREIFCFPFEQVIDNGSLLHLKKQIQELWAKKGR